MKTYDIIRRAGRSLKQAKIRTLLTSLAIGVGAFTITMSLAAGEGGRQYTEKLIAANADTGSLIVAPHFDNKQRDAADKPREIGATEKPQATPFLTQSDLDKIASINGVEKLVPSYDLTAQYVTREGQKKYQMSVGTLTDRVVLDFAAGSLPRSGLATREVVMPEDYISVLGFKNAQEAVGKSIIIHFGTDETYTIAAVDKKPETALSYQPSVRLSADESRRIYDLVSAGSPRYGKYFNATATVASSANASAVQENIKAKGYDVFSARDIQTTLFQFIDIVQWGTAGFGALAILASIFGIINTQYISVLERTQQIGLMKALGMRSRDVAALFRYEAAWIGFLGGAIGTGLAFIAGVILNPIIANALDLGKGTNLLIFQPLVVAALIASLILIAIVAGYFPARKAAKLDPIEALRTE